VLSLLQQPLTIRDAPSAIAERQLALEHDILKSRGKPLGVEALWKKGIDPARPLPKFEAGAAIGAGVSQ
jgi:hypothetical protein